MTLRTLRQLTETRHSTNRPTGAPWPKTLQTPPTVAGSSGGKRRLDAEPSARPMGCRRKAVPAAALPPMQNANADIGTGRKKSPRLKNDVDARYCDAYGWLHQDRPTNGDENDHQRNANHELRRHNPVPSRRPSCLLRGLRKFCEGRHQPPPRRTHGQGVFPGSEPIGNRPALGGRWMPEISFQRIRQEMYDAGHTPTTVAQQTARLLNI